MAAEDILRVYKDEAFTRAVDQSFGLIKDRVTILQYTIARDILQDSQYQIANYECHV